MTDIAPVAPTTPPRALTPPSIGSLAPGFSARTTMGECALEAYRGRWLVFFSHPADFTPVCTSEFIAFARHYPAFQAAGCDLLALSVDSLFAHIAWVCAITRRFGVTIPFPIVEDPSMAIAAAYGMIRPGAPDAATVRTTFVIDPAGVVRAILSYPMSTGRSVAEILRLVRALQAVDTQGAWTPEGWQPGEDLLEPAPQTVAEALARLDVDEGPARRQAGDMAPDWYFRPRTVP